MEYCLYPTNAVTYFSVRELNNCLMMSCCGAAVYGLARYFFLEAPIVERYENSVLDNLCTACGSPHDCGHVLVKFNFGVRVPREALDELYVFFIIDCQPLSHGTRRLDSRHLAKW